MSPITSIPEPEQAAIWPVVGVSNPAINPSSVDLPLPDAPVMAMA